MPYRNKQDKRKHEYEYYRRNKEEILLKKRKRAKKWYYENRERAILKKREYIKNNYQKIHEQQKQRQKTNKYRTYAREYMRNKIGYYKNKMKMKIKLSDDETYEMDFPVEMSGKEFLDFTDKLEKVIKLVRLSNLGNLNEFRENFNSRVTRPYKKKFHTNSYFDSKEKVLDIMQYFYHGTKEDRQRIAKLIGFNEDEIVKRFFSFKKRYNLQPQDIGFVIFGTRETPHGIKVKDYIIKSYTGIFDEKEV